MLSLPGMGWSDAHAEGFALAAIVADERDLTWAHTYVDPAFVARASEHVVRVRGSDDKRVALAQLVAGVSGEAVPRAPYATWLDEITKLRAQAKASEREPSEELVSFLRRMARAERDGP